MNSKLSLNAGVGLRWLALAMLLGSNLALAGPMSVFDQAELEQIANRRFPGYRIIPRHEFSPAIQAFRPEPAIVQGAFTRPDTREFAALIRNETEQRSIVGKTEYKFLIRSSSFAREVLVKKSLSNRSSFR